MTRLVVDSSVVIKYERMYLALAEALSTHVATADRRMYNA